MTASPRKSPTERPTSWWLSMLRRRAAHMYEEKLDLSQPIVWTSEAQRQAAIAFFNAAFRAEESGLRQAHELAEQIARSDAELGECLRLYGNEEGWHRELLTEFLAYLGGEVRPMGRITGTFYKVYGRAKRTETIVLTNLMFETIGSTTYRLALRRAKHPAVRQMLTILTRDESFHVPLNVHFLRKALQGAGVIGEGTTGAEAARPALRQALNRARLQAIHHLLFGALILSAAASRRRAKRFDNIPFRELATAYADQLARLFLHEPDLALSPPHLILRAFGLRRADLIALDHPSAVSTEAAEAAADRENVVVTAL